MRDADALGRDARAADVRHLVGATLLDRDARAVGAARSIVEIGRGDVERDAVRLGQDGERVGADLVGGVAVGGDPVGADDDGVDLARRMKWPAMLSVISGHGDAVLLQLPGGEPGALQAGAGLVGEHVRVACPARGGADDAERGAVAGGRERAGVAVGEDTALAGHQLRTQA